MGANKHTVAVGATPAALRQALGYVPPRQAVGADGVTVDGGPNPVVGGPPVGVDAVTFGTGAPPGTPVPADGDLYFDTTLAVYVGYVGRTGVWHKF